MNDDSGRYPRRAWLRWAAVGAVVGLLVGMSGVTVVGYSDMASPPEELLEVMVFGVPVHRWTTLTEKWAGRMLGLGLTMTFAFVGAVAASGIATGLNGL